MFGRYYEPGVLGVISVMFNFFDAKIFSFD